MLCLFHFDFVSVPLFCYNFLVLFVPLKAQHNVQELSAKVSSLQSANDILNAELERVINLCFVNYFCSDTIISYTMYLVLSYFVINDMCI